MRGLPICSRRYYLKYDIHRHNTRVRPVKKGKVVPVVVKAYGWMEVEFNAFFRSTVDGVKSSASQFGRSRLGERDDIIHSTGGRMGLSICRAEKSVPELMTSIKCGTKQAVVQGHNTERMARDRTSGYRMGYEILSCAEWLRFVWGFVAVLANQIDPNIVALRTPQNSCTEHWIH